MLPVALDGFLGGSRFLEVLHQVREMLSRWHCCYLFVSALLIGCAVFVPQLPSSQIVLPVTELWIEMASVDK